MRIRTVNVGGRKKIRRQANTEAGKEKPAKGEAGEKIKKRGEGQKTKSVGRLLRQKPRSVFSSRQREGVLG